MRTIFRLQQDQLVAEMATWAWQTPRGKPVFNFVSEKRDFAHSDRVLILTTGFYEYTEPATPSVKLKDKHLFSRPGEDWFWIAGIVKQGCFTMLTTVPGPDVARYHDRQIVTLSAALWKGARESEDGNGRIVGEGVPYRHRCERSLVKPPPALPPPLSVRQAN